MSNDPIQAYRDAAARHQAACVALVAAEDAYNAALKERNDAYFTVEAAGRTMQRHILSTPATQPE